MGEEEVQARDSGSVGGAGWEGGKAEVKRTGGEMWTTGEGAGWRKDFMERLRRDMDSMRAMRLGSLRGAEKGNFGPGEWE